MSTSHKAYEFDWSGFRAILQGLVIVEPAGYKKLLANAMQHNKGILVTF